MEKYYKGTMLDLCNKKVKTVFLELIDNDDIYRDIINTDDIYIKGRDNTLTSSDSTKLVSDIRALSIKELINELKFINDKAFVIVKPDGVVNLGGILEMITNQGLTITKVRKHIFSIEEAKMRYAHLVDNPDYPRIIENIISEESFIIEVQGKDAINTLREIRGPIDPKEENSENTIRGTFGYTKTCNAIELANGSDEEQSIEKILNKK